MQFVSTRSAKINHCAASRLTFYVDLSVGNAALVSVTPGVTAHQCIKAWLFRPDRHCADSFVDHSVLALWKNLAVQHPHSLTGSPTVVVKHTVHCYFFSRPGDHLSRDVAHC